MKYHKTKELCRVFSPFIYLYVITVFGSGFVVAHCSVHCVRVLLFLALYTLCRICGCFCPMACTAAEYCVMGAAISCYHNRNCIVLGCAQTVFTYTNEGIPPWKQAGLISCSISRVSHDRTRLLFCHLVTVVILYPHFTKNILLDELLHYIKSEVTI